MPIVTVVEVRSQRANPARRLGVRSVYLIHLAGFQATGAHAHCSHAALVHDFCALQIRFPAPLGFVVCVADVEADHRLFTTYVANPRQRGHLPDKSLHFKCVMLYSAINQLVSKGSIIPLDIQEKLGSHPAAAARIGSGSSRIKDRARRVDGPNRGGATDPRGARVDMVCRS